MAANEPRKRPDGFGFSELMPLVPFEEAFPTVEDLQLEVQQKMTGDAGGSAITFDRSTVRSFVACRNPVCVRGGVDIGAMIQEMARKRETQRKFSELCKGNEGSPKGRKIYRKCLNHFTVAIFIRYKPD